MEKGRQGNMKAGRQGDTEKGRNRDSGNLETMEQRDREPET